MPSPPDRFTLAELAEHVATELCAAQREAVAVQDGDIEPPESWRKEIDWLARRYVVRQASVPLWDFDRNDKPIAVTFLGAPNSDAAFHKWMDDVADWRARVAEVRTKWRKCYKYYYRQKPQADARRIVTGRMATAKIEAAEAEVTKLVHTAMIAPDAVVRATPEEGYHRRQLDRAEILDAVVDIAHNAMAIEGALYKHVEIEVPSSPATQSAPPKPAQGRGNNLGNSARRNTQSLAQSIGEWLYREKPMAYLSTHSTIIASAAARALELPNNPCDRTITRARKVASDLFSKKDGTESD